VSFGFGVEVQIPAQKFSMKNSVANFRFVSQTSTYEHTQGRPYAVQAATWLLSNFSGPTVSRVHILCHTPCMVYINAGCRSLRQVGGVVHLGSTGFDTQQDAAASCMTSSPASSSISRAVSDSTEAKGHLTLVRSQAKGQRSTRPPEPTDRAVAASLEIDGTIPTACSNYYPHCYSCLML
jgi:hypothetical protein